MTACGSTFKKDIHKGSCMRKSLILVLVLILISPFNAYALDYKVIHVVDGDTFVATDGIVEFKVRIVGMDAPESKQDYGQLAKAFLAKLVEDQMVTLKPIKKPLDRYNRVLAQVFVHDADVADLMIAEGLAYYYRPTCQDYPIDKKKYDFDPVGYVEKEAMAKKQNLGFWKEAARQLPCQYRKLHPYR